MVFRRMPFVFGKRATKNKTTKWIINELPKTFNDRVYPELPFMIHSRRTNIKNPYDKSVGGQLYGLTFNVTDLFRDERIKLYKGKAREIRPHVEMLIYEAMRNGDLHKPTMALANFWLRDKSLIHKLFKVIVPRYSDYNSSFTAVHLLGMDYLKCLDKIPKGVLWRDEVILELRGNSLPPIIRPKLERHGLLNNILIDGARKASATITTVAKSAE